MKEKKFLGNCMGVRLHPRGEKDNHIMFQLLVEDDENWFARNDEQGGASSGWIDELIEVLTEARDWMKKNGKPDIDEVNGNHYGWNFKKEKKR